MYQASNNHIELQKDNNPTKCGTMVRALSMMSPNSQQAHRNAIAHPQLTQRNTFKKVTTQVVMLPQSRADKVFHPRMSGREWEMNFKDPSEKEDITSNRRCRRGQSIHPKISPSSIPHLW